jgi:hypothetical protein
VKPVEQVTRGDTDHERFEDGGQPLPEVAELAHDGLTFLPLTLE